MSWDPSKPHSIEKLQIIYKIAERCNLNCTYCYYYNIGDATALERPALASPELSTQLAHWLSQGCTQLDIPKVTISFHGGEPMLMRSLEFAKTCETLVRTLSPVVDLSFSIQTNGTLLTDGWLEALKQFKVSVGVSIDGRRRDHDRFRIDHAGKSSFNTTQQAIHRLMEASVEHPHLRPGTISVLHPEVDYRATYRYLRQLGVRSMHFLLPDRSADEASPETAATARAIGKGMMNIFESWMEEDDPEVQVRFISEALGHFEMGRSVGWEKRPRKQNQILVARSDGTVTVDDSLIPALQWYSTTPQFKIENNRLQEVFADPVFQFLESQAQTLPTKCTNCRWSKICRGGDLENRFSKDRGFDNPSVYCETYKEVYQGICDMLVGNGYPQSEVEQRFGAHHV